MNATEKRIKEMFMRQLDDGLNDVEMDELLQYMDDPILAQYIERHIGELFSIDEGNESLSYEQKNTVLSSIFKDKPTTVTTLFSWYRIAAAVIIFCLGIGSIYIWKQKNSATPDIVFLNDTGEKLLKLETAHAQNRKIILPDGTIVLLNSGSELYYSEEYGKSNRTVRLVGEGYFDVVKDADHPFLIEGLSYNVRVLGTKFNVKNYPNEISETSLISGSLEILDKKTNQRRAILKPLQKFVVEERDHLDGSEVKMLVPVKESNGSIIGEVAWMQKRLVFQNAKIETILKDLERTYDVRFEVRLPEILNYRFTATFEEDSLEDILESLKYIKTFKTMKDGNTIIIY